MLVPQRDVDVAVPATVKQLGERGALLREDREASVPQIMESKRASLIAPKSGYAEPRAPLQRHKV